MKEFLRFFKFFYTMRGLGVFYLVGLMFVASLLDVVSASMFVPLLENQETPSKISEFILNSFSRFNVTYSFSRVLIVMVGLFFVRSFFVMIKEVYMGKVTSELLTELRAKIVEKFFKVDYQYFLKKDTGYINNAVVVEINQVSFAFKMFAGVLTRIIFALVYIAVPLFIYPKVVLISIALGLPAVFVLRKINQVVKKYSIQTSNHSASLQNFLIQTLQSYKYFKATGTFASLLKKIKKETKELSLLRYKQSVMQAIMISGFTPFVFLGVACLLYYQVEVLGNGVTESLFIMFFLLRGLEALLKVQQNYSKFLMSVGSINVYQKLNEELDFYKELEGNADKKPDFDQPIVFENVHFSYGDENEVLSNINFSIPKKATVAFVGSSGSGKTTLVNLLTKVLKPTSGVIRMGEDDISEINTEDLRKKLGYVTQEGMILNDTLENNLKLWQGSAENQADLDRTIEQVKLKEFVAQLPLGYQTQLGDQGLMISGGQRQRISIARELLKDSELLIFDEATSSLDSETEEVIQRSIKSFRGERTVIIVAHRLATIQHADIIFVFKEGKIVEQGEYEELYQKKEFFVLWLIYKIYRQ